MAFAHTLAGVRYTFDSLAQLLAQATPLALAISLQASAQEGIAAQLAIAELPLQRFLDEAAVPYETNEVTRLIFDVY